MPPNALTEATDRYMALVATSNRYVPLAEAQASASAALRGRAGNAGSIKSDSNKDYIFVKKD